MNPPAVWQQVLAVAMAALALVLLPRNWRGGKHWTSQPPLMWIWDDVAWRAGLRTLPAGTALFVFGAGLLLSFDIDRALGTGWVYPVMFTAFGITAIVTGTVFFANRPRWLIPPRLRGQPSALEEWNLRRRDRATDPSREEV